MTPRMNHSVRCQASPDDQQPQGNDVGPPAVCGRLLVAEDSSAFRYLLASALRADGHDVVEVSNGVDLMDMLGGSLIPEWGAAPFDLVLSDVRMPGWSGIDALASLGHDFPLPPVVFDDSFWRRRATPSRQECGGHGCLGQADRRRRSAPLCDPAPAAKGSLNLPAAPGACH